MHLLLLLLGLYFLFAEKKSYKDLPGWTGQNLKGSHGSMKTWNKLIVLSIWIYETVYCSVVLNVVRASVFSPDFFEELYMFMYFVVNNKTIDFIVKLWTSIY